MKKGWETKKLGEVCDFQGGSQPPKSEFIYEPKKGYVRFLQIRDFASDKNITYIPESKKNRYCDEDDILLGRYGASVGKVLINKAGAYNVAVMKTIPDETILFKRYLFFYLNTDDFQTRLLNTASRSAQDGFSKDDIFDFPILLPPFPEQQRIVAVLDEAFAAIAKAKANTEQNLNNVKELFNTSLSQAVIGEITKKWRKEYDLEKVNGFSELNRTLLQIRSTKRKSTRGEGTVGHESITELLPKEWGVTNIEALFNLIDYRGKNPPRSNKGYRLITAKNIKMGYLSEEPVTFISEETYKKWMVRGFPKLGDIFFVTEGHTMGFVALNTREDDFALAQRTITLQPAVPFDTKFFYYFFLSSYFQDIVKLNATGAAAVGMKGSKFRSLPLPFPSVKEQQVIVQKLDALSTEIKKLEAIYQQKINDLEELKKSILQKAFAGELKTEKLLAI
jgi:type I restriction enzyme S subunit